MSEETIQAYRLSPQQKHLWLVQQRTRSSAFWSRCAVRITGPLDRDRLESAIYRVVEQHEILRTTFRLLPGMTVPAQVIHDESPSIVEWTDLSTVSPEKQDELVRNRFSAELRFAYDRLPLFRCDLLRLAPDETVMLLKAPAVCTDLRSLEIIVSQIAICYGSNDCTTEAMQYADFAEWHHELLEGEAATRGKQYWDSQTPRTGLKISFANPIAEETQFQPELIRLEFSPDERNSRLALAAWQVLIQRLTGSPEITIAKAFDDRKYPELLNSVGLYNRYLPLTVDFDEQLTIDQLLQRLAQIEEEASQWQEYFAWPETTDDPICFEERTGASIFSADDVTFSIYDRSVTDDRFQLKLVAVPDEANPYLELHYDANRYQREDIRRLGSELTTLIADASREPGKAIIDLESLNSAERSRIVKDFNQTTRNFPENCIHKLFEAQAQKTSNIPAVVCGSIQITYAELNQRANQLARYLQKLGVGPEIPVGLCLERSIDFVVAMLAILKAGGVYVPLDVNTPVARLETMLSEAGATLLLTERTQTETLPNCRILRLDDVSDELAKEKIHNCPNEATPANLAYVIFTSGSTGKPKGVGVEHRQLCNYVYAIDDKIGLSFCRSFAVVSSLVADLAHTMLFPSLLTGGTLHLIPEDHAANPEILADYFSRTPVDCLKIVPIHLSALLASTHAVDILPRRHLILGGEAPSVKLLEKIRQLSHEVAIWNHYGPTETTVGCSAQQIDLERSQVIAIGTPLSNNTVYILDQSLRPVSIGVAGELFVGGNQVARGYVNRPDLTAERFVPDQFGDSGGCRLYRTGDLACYLSDGRIELLGRVDHQVKVRGYRIELEEIQFALNRHANVSQSVVLAREDRPGEKRLVAYVVTKESANLTAKDLRTFLEEQLPDYMVPWTFVFLKAFPLTRNGKLDRQALPAPEAVEKQHVAPRNPIEQELSRIWASVLGIPEPGINDNFFELGGDSILGIQIIARANQAGMNLVTRQIFQYQTIAALAAVAQNGLRPRAEQGIVTGEVPLTPVQARFFKLALPEPHHYNQAKLLKLGRPIDSTYLKDAIASLLRHHDALRLRFEPSGETWKQFNSAPESDLPFECIDISDCDESEVTERLRLEANRLHASLNLQVGPILRIALFDGADKTDSYLLIVVHHLAIDAVSWSVLVEDLETAYRQLSNAEEISLPAKTTSFKAWAEQLVQFAKSNVIEEEINYWTSNLAKPCVTLPVDRHGLNSVASRRTVSTSLTAAETRAVLQDLPTKHRTQINEVLLAAITRTFTRWMGSPSFLIDLEGHGREHLIEGTDVARTVGWFTTIFPVLFDIGNSSTPLEVLRAVKEQLRAIPNRGIGYGALRYLSGRADVVDQLERSPQAEVRFNYLGQLDRSLASSDLFAATEHSSGQAQSPKGERGYLLNIISSVTNSELRFDWTYSENIHARTTIESLAENCVAELRALLSETAGPVYAPADFPKAKLSQSDLNTILAKLRTS
ncbi:MAG TPA: amino acid adenylation domain-containing protein [Pyrinomonadaceae bacterium]